MAEDKDIAILADNDIIVEIEVQEAPVVVVETPNTTTAEISGDSALGIVVGTLPALAKEETLAQVTAKVDEVKEAVSNIDLSPIESKVEEESNAVQAAIQNIKLPEIDTTELAQESTLQEVSAKLDNLNVDVDLSLVAKQGENQEATNSAIYNAIGDVAAALTTIDEILGEL